MGLDGRWLFAIHLCSLFCPLFSDPLYLPHCISSSSSLVFPPVFCPGPPSSLLSLWRYPLPFTWPKLLNLFFLNLLLMSSRSHLLRTSSLGTLSCHLTTAIYLNILLSVVLIIFFNPTVKGHVSEPYNRTSLMHASYTLAWCLKGTPRVTKTQEAGYLLPLQPGCRDPSSNCHLYTTFGIQLIAKIIGTVYLIHYLLSNTLFYCSKTIGAQQKLISDS